MAASYSITYTCTRDLHSFLSFANPPQSSLCCTRSLSHNPTNLASVYRYLPSTYFRHQQPFSHTVLIESLHVERLDELRTNLLRTMPLVQLLLHIDACSYLYQILISQHTFQLSPCFIPFIRRVQHSYHILNPLPLATPST